MDAIIEINRHRFFTLEEAQNLLPLVFRVTEDASREVRRLMQCLETLPDRKSERAKQVELQIDGIVDRWQQKIERLGAKPKGLWLADFDKGDGYWCWKYPETKIAHYHGYQDGFSGRKMVHTPGEAP